ncbi:hypothetical protein [Actinocrispum wychmicini]|uniref:Uncharacterized protein n=1 Tax=Actinocrispum wychmicini TaxID=1213861 RepID=A0A4R2JRG2_9PSEU|nr:hypothetical protein [Actinocrispum wychmicini]TCO62841.1 hypothetical protein EV192_102980 [Actinocrispum wychmicini]
MAVLLAACGNGGGGSAEVSGGSDIPVPPVSSGATGPIPPAVLGVAQLPLSVYSGTNAQNDILDRAVELLTQTCMRGKGFDYKVVDPASGAQKTLVKGDYGITDKAQAAVNGYRDPHVVSVDSSGKVHTPPGVTAETGPAESPDYMIALEGSATGPLSDGQGRIKRAGCRNEALFTIHDYDNTRARADLDLPGRLADEANQRAARHPEVTAAVNAWSSCMKGKGYRYSTPQEPMNTKWPDKPSAEEIATALADISCKEQTGLVTTWVNTIVAYQRELIDRSAATLAELKKITDEQVKRAEDVLAGR